ncbi:MAG: hypothetical protein AABX70_01020 [Nanoarchaeota archaeon]
MTQQDPVPIETTPTISKDELISIRPSQEEKNEPETKIDDYALLEKSFDNINYEYDERTKDFRLVCTTPCPVPKETLDQEFAAIAYAVSTVRGLTKSDINSFLLPFEVHASADEICAMKQGALAYATSYRDSDGRVRGLLCFFFDQREYDRTRFPYSTSVHEVMHLFEFGKIEENSAILEGLSEVLESFFLQGAKTSFCDQHNKWWLTEQGINPHDPHDTGRDLFFNLCDQHGFDYNDLPTLFEKLDSLGREATTQEFIQIINQIVGQDTTHLFQEAGAI